jgi:hypothetical protein
MAPSREDFQLLLQIEQAMKPGKAAKQFVWSDGVKGDYAGPGFFDKYGWDSDERIHVNEVASYYEVFAMAWQCGFVDEEFVLEWVPATLYWGLILAPRHVRLPVGGCAEQLDSAACDFGRAIRPSACD